MRHTGFTDKSPFTQPDSGCREYQLLNGSEEVVDYLEGTSIRICYTHRGTCFPDHWHSAMEIIEGCFNHYDCTAGGRDFVIGEGDILIIPGGVVHSLRPSQDCNGFVYFLGLEYLEKIRSSASLTALLSEPSFISAERTPALRGRVAALLDRMRTDYFSSDELRELRVDSSALLVLAELARAQVMENDDLHSRTDKQNEYRELFARVTAYIAENYAQPLTIEEAAARFGMSKYYFSRLFGTYTKYSFGEYLNLCRVKAAERLLADPELSVTDIAFRCGFGSGSSFSRVFHDLRGCSPSDYRRLFVKAVGGAAAEP